MDPTPLLCEKLVIHLQNGEIQEFKVSELISAFKTFKEYHLRFD